MNFHIDSTGLITNKTDLAVGDYYLEISVWDAYDNLDSHVIRVRVIEITILPPATPPVVLMIGLGAGAVVVVVVIVMVVRKRPG